MPGICLCAFSPSPPAYLKAWDLVTTLRSTVLSASLKSMSAVNCSIAEQAMAPTTNATLQGRTWKQQGVLLAQRPWQQQQQQAEQFDEVALHMKVGDTADVASTLDHTC